MLLKIPSPDPSAVKALVRRYLFEEQNPNLLRSELLTDIVNAAQVENIKEFPSADQAVDYFEQLVVWRPNRDINDMLGFTQNEERQLAELAGEVLARSVVPVLPSEGLTKENFLFGGRGSRDSNRISIFCYCKRGFYRASGETD
ncbi:hypothetical protein D3C85_1342040 [compost metagenome]